MIRASHFCNAPQTTIKQPKNAGGRLAAASKHRSKRETHFLVAAFLPAFFAVFFAVFFAAFLAAFFFAAIVIILWMGYALGSE